MTSKLLIIRGCGIFLYMSCLEFTWLEVFGQEDGDVVYLSIKYFYSLGVNLGIYLIH